MLVMSFRGVVNYDFERKMIYLDLPNGKFPSFSDIKVVVFLFFESSLKSGVVSVQHARRLTWILKTPDYDHLSVGSNELSGKKF